MISWERTTPENTISYLLRYVQVEDAAQRDHTLTTVVQQ
jgi:hypothetical protein